MKKPPPHPVELLAMTGGPMSGDESDLASVPLPPCPWELAVQSLIANGLARDREEALRMIDEAF
jgi:hypothetical protein